MKFYLFKDRKKLKSIIDLVAKKGIINIRQMIENDWMADIAFFHQLTGIDLNYLNSYMVSEQNFELANVTDYWQSCP